MPDTTAAPAPPLIVRCGAFGDMVMLTTLMRLVSARYRSPVDVISSGGWTPPLMAREPTLGHLQMVTSRKTPYLLCPSQWALVRWLRGRGRGPVYLGDTDPQMRALLARGGVHPDDIVARDPAGEDAPVPWPDRWLELGQRDPAAAWPTVEVDAAAFRYPRLVVREADRADLDGWLSGHGLHGPVVLLQPGNKRTHKRGRLMTADHPKHWDAANWAAVALAILAGMPDAHVVLCGSPPEHPLLEDIRTAAQAHPRLFNAASELPIPRLLALIERARGMVSVDTGPAHAAAALGCPLVVMFGAAPPEKWRPIGPGAIHVLGGARGAQSRVADIPVDTVVAAWRALPARE